MTGLTYGTAEEAGMDPARIERLKAQAPKWVDGFRTRSFVGLVARRGKIVFHEAYGPLTEAPGSPPALKDSRFIISSVTKPITAALAMMLVEDGTLGLNRPIREYLPEICGEGTEEIEVQHLLTHTSGYNDDTWFKGFLEDPAEISGLDCTPLDNPHPYNQWKLDQMWADKSFHPPGSLAAYANKNFDLVGEIIRRVAGQSLAAFARERLFDPMGLKDASYVRDPQTNGRLVRRGMDGPAGVMPGAPYAGVEGIISRDAAWGCGGVECTAFELASFGQMFLDRGRSNGQQILSPASVREMTRNQIPGVGVDAMGRQFDEASLGLGFMIQGDVRWPWLGSTLLPKGTAYHYGLGGHQLWIDTKNEVVGVYLSVSCDLDWLNDVHHWDGDLFANMAAAAVLGQGA